MRNPDLDKKFAIDSQIGELQFEEDRFYRLIDGVKVFQLEEKTQENKDLNLILNRERITNK